MRSTRSVKKLKHSLPRLLKIYFCYKMRTGGVGICEQEDAMYSGVIKRALCALNEQVGKDAAMLAAHQQIADITLALDEAGLQCDPDNGKVRRILDRVHRNESNVRERMTKQAWRYHALSPKGMALHLEPLAQAVQNGDALAREAADDPFIQGIVTGTSKQSLEENSTDEECEEIEDSFGAQDVKLCQDDDGNAACGCAFCTRLFEPISISGAQLTSLQLWLAQHYGVLLDDD